MEDERATLDYFSFLSGHACDVAQLLIGCRLVRIRSNEIETYRIVETEAYHESEPGSHTYRGKTKRNSTMYETYGLLYVYLIYGMHYCANIVCGKAAEGSAILIRAIEPINQVETVNHKNLLSNAETKRCAGPGKLCRELNITKEMNGIDLLDKGNEKLFLLPKPLPEKITINSATRIGVSRGIDLEWRFFEADNPYVSKRN